MLFSSLVFLFLFLPAVLLIYYLLPNRFRNAFLLAANLVFYGFGEPAFVLLMIFSTIINYAGGLLIACISAYKKRKAALAVTVGANLLLLGIFKYAGLIGNTIRLLPWFNCITVLSVPLPIGISFYTFQGMSYLIDVYRDDCEAEHSLVTFGTYISLFPQLIAGPIVRYRDVSEALADPYRESKENFSLGAEIFLIGLSKKVLLANPLGSLWSRLSETSEPIGIIGAWLGAVAFSLQLYFDFSGYSDMACGLGKMFGLTFCENFNYPYTAKSVTDFWRRWHMSLTTWFRDYVYIPLGGNRRSTPRVLLNIAVVWTLTGLWHGASWNFVCWGLYYAVILIIEKMFLKTRLEKLPVILQRAYTLFIVVFGWMLFALEDITKLKSYLPQMFGFGLKTDAAPVSLILAYVPLIIVALFACTPYAKRLFVSLKEKPKRVIAGGLSVIAIVLCTASLVSDSYNPFLYFRF